MATSMWSGLAASWHGCEPVNDSGARCRQREEYTEREHGEHTDGRQYPEERRGRFGVGARHIIVLGHGTSIASATRWGCGVRSVQ